MREPAKTPAKPRHTENPEQRFFALIRHIFWTMRAEADSRLEPLGLSNALWRPLLLLNGREGPITQADMARQLGLESPTVVRLLDRLTEAGMVVRRHCPHDRRAWHVELTPQARGLCAQIEDVLVGLRRDLLANVKPAALKSAVETLEIVAANPPGGPGPRSAAPVPRGVAKRRRGR